MPASALPVWARSPVAQLSLIATHLRTVAAAVVETVHAPPATVFLQALHSQIPTAVRLTESLPQKVHVYRARWLISIFLDSFRREAPYRVPYFPAV